MLKADNLTKIFHSGDEEVVVFENLNFEIQPGEMLALVGASGAGKTTLLHMLAALDTPTRGEVYFLGKKLSNFSKDEQALYRNSKVGFVWQMHYLLPEFTVVENVMLPQLIAGKDFSAARVRARELLTEVGLGKAEERRAGEISGGEQQRVALARALANQPAILLADEPTGNLDGRTAELVMEMLERLHREHSLTTIVATHNLDLARRSQRTLSLSGGQLAATSSKSQQSE